MSRPTAPSPVWRPDPGVLEVRPIGPCRWKSWSGLVGPLSLGSVVRLASLEGPAGAGRPPGSRTGTAGRSTR